MHFFTSKMHPVPSLPWLDQEHLFIMSVFEFELEEDVCLASVWCFLFIPEVSSLSHWYLKMEFHLCLMLASSSMSVYSWQICVNLQVWELGQQQILCWWGTALQEMPTWTWPLVFRETHSKTGCVSWRGVRIQPSRGRCSLILVEFSICPFTCGMATVADLCPQTDAQHLNASLPQPALFTKFLYKWNQEDVARVFVKSMS